MGERASGIPDTLRAWFLAVVGVVVLGLGSAILRVSGVGVDPYTAANIGISGRLGMQLGVYQLLSNAVLLVLVVIWGRRHLGAGTIINAVLSGYAVQWFSALLAPLVSVRPGALGQTIAFVIGIVLFAFGAAMYMGAGIGKSPYDAIAPMVVDHTRATYRPVRTAQDLVFVALGILFGGSVGMGTVMTAFFAGPLIDFFSQRVIAPLAGRRSPTDRTARTDR